LGRPSSRLPGDLGALCHRVRRDGELHHLRCDQKGLVLPPGLCSSPGHGQFPGAFQATAQVRQELIGETDPEPPDLEAVEPARGFHHLRGPAQQQRIEHGQVTRKRRRGPGSNQQGAALVDFRQAGKEQHQSEGQPSHPAILAPPPALHPPQLMEYDSRAMRRLTLLPGGCRHRRPGPT